MTTYEPAEAPDPAEWFALDEQERISLIEAHHRSAKVELPDATLHATFHAIVENQLAEGMESTRDALARLMKQGVTRHEALHAIGAVVSSHVFQALQSGVETDSKKLDAKLARLTAKRWKRGLY